MYTGTLPPVSNRASWIVDVDATDYETGAVFDWNAADAIQLSVRDHNGCELLSASLAGGGITLTATPGRITWTMSADDMGKLCPGTYDIGLAYRAAGIVETLIAGQLPIVEGVARIA